MNEKCLKIVLKQYIAMLENIADDFIFESFIGFCEDGDVFYFMEDLTNEEKKECEKIMYEIDKASKIFSYYLYEKIENLKRGDN